MACYLSRDSNYHVSICTLWFNPPNTDAKYNMLGYCRTRAGIKLMAQTLLAHPQVTDLIVITDDPRGMLEEVKSINTVMQQLSRLDGELIRVHEQKWDELNTDLPKTDQLHPDIRVVIEKQMSRESNWPRLVGYSYHGKTVKKLYHQALNLIETRGVANNLRNIPIKEIECLTLNLSKQSSSEIYDSISELYAKSVLNDYLSRYDISKVDFSDKSNQPYEYLRRILQHCGTIENIVSTLNNTKSWIPIFKPEDYTSSEKPCCVGVQFVLTNENLLDQRLDLVVVFRSHDIKDAWLLNIMGFRYFQEQIHKLCPKDVLLGSITSVSINAHAYQNSDNSSQELFLGSNINEYLEDDFDPIDGYYVISGEGNDIVVKYYDHYATFIKEYRSPMNEYETLIEKITNTISSPSHAGYVAKEICKVYFSSQTCSI